MTLDSCRKVMTGYVTERLGNRSSWRISASTSVSSINRVTAQQSFSYANPLTAPAINRQRCTRHNFFVHLLNYNVLHVLRRINVFIIGHAKVSSTLFEIREFCDGMSTHTIMLI